MPRRRDAGWSGGRPARAHLSRPISADTALRLGKYFGTSPEIWLDLQSDCELRIARQTTWLRVEPTVQIRVA